MRCPRRTARCWSGTKIVPGQSHTEGRRHRGRARSGASLPGSSAGQEAYALVADADRTATNPGTALDELFKRLLALPRPDRRVGRLRAPALRPVTICRPARSTPSSPSPRRSPRRPRPYPARCSWSASRPARRRAPARAPANRLGDIEVGGEGGRAALERLRNVIGAHGVAVAAGLVRGGLRDRPSAPLRAARRRPKLQASATRSSRPSASSTRAEAASSRRTAREADYSERIQTAYPIHPELFDRLYNDWSTLPRFQRTRGVLRLMADVIHELWESGDQAPADHAGAACRSTPRGVVRADALPRGGWKPVIDTDVDGPNSLPLRLDRENPNFGKLSACTACGPDRLPRFGRTLKQPNKGIDDRRIKLGCVQPGESAGGVRRRAAAPERPLHPSLPGDGALLVRHPAEHAAAGPRPRRAGDA